MRISDWSSDVCSADLPDNGRPFHSLFLLLEESYRKCSSSLQQQQPRRPLKIPTVLRRLSSRAVLSPGPFFSFFAPCLSVPSISCSQSSSNSRSEEHTSELQSLMRTSYADFCLKKKKRY